MNKQQTCLRLRPRQSHQNAIYFMQNILGPTRLEVSLTVCLSSSDCRNICLCKGLFLRYPGKWTLEGAKKNSETADPCAIHWIIIQCLLVVEKRETSYMQSWR